MTPRWRLLCVVVLCVLLVKGSEWISTGAPKAEDQPRLDVAGRQADPTPQRSGSLTPGKVTRIVPLYDAGSLPVLQLNLPSSATAAPTPTQSSVQQAREAGPDRATFEKGTWPILELEYDQLGFDRYLGVIEKLGGRFYLLINGTALGPEVSLRQGLILGPRAEGGAATDRPYLVSDSVIRKRLADVELPFGAARGSVVLLLSRWIDESLWKVIERSVSRQGLALEDISLVKGSYVKDGAGVYLRLDTALVREGGRRVTLGTRLKLSQ